ncbi:GH92 family glycosyl hydrolase [Granulicella tundricola]|uniref:Alpha-1,2-mannosidase n=1 Tax=Granulicella tundricola (strain ATCC BAA-1859 / DSM 23138 / MP5ACTX9) TaxID=1198114 RepID=E8X2K1_GRATM|nr:GH92 family glycosyl hydrolase [Granulicella tundricola]ADW69225.1 alpha-1,2-mannosidase [Granulicella tundricola MP5ACTX9]
MSSRREFIQGTAGVCAAAWLSSAAVLAEPSAQEEEVLRWVDPRIGTGGHGHCYPGASVPFGAVQLSPDTFNDGWDWCAGYHVSDSSIMGFSHTHLSGTGCGDLLDFLVMAGTGPAKIVPGTREKPEDGYRSRFSHEDEVATPGYYSVLLKDYQVRAELSATERAGIHRYTFPASDEAYLILDLQHAYLDDGKPTVVSSELKRIGPDTFTGGRVTKAWGNGRHAYFSMQLSKAPTRVVYYSDDKEVPAGALEGKNLKCVMYFKTKAQETILVKTGISGVSAEAAGKNVKAEIPAWNFEKVRSDARAKWSRQIGKIQVTSANEAHKRVFYTALYHMSLGPTLFDDVDGTYRGMDQQMHTLPAGRHNYTTFSAWDTYRAAHPAYTLIETERVPDFVNTLIRMAAESPQGMPVWPLQGCETGTMTGYHSAAIISEAINKGFKGIDEQLAYQVMMKRAMVDNYRGLGYYRKMNYIPADLEDESVSKTFEYCYDDWAIAHVSKKLGKSDDAALLVKRSTNYKNYFDPSVGFMRPKLQDASFTTPFNPIDMGHMKKWRDYTESNAWQTTFAVQHDPAGLIALFGGREPFLAKLDELFTTASTLPADAPPDIAGMVGQYAHGNEPSHHIAYLYVYAGAPHKTQARVRSLMETMYSPNPDGMQGNEDVGQMSAWFLLSALGFYPVDAVSGNYILGSPLFEHATVNVGGGKKLEIEVKRSDPAHAYIQAFSLNGEPQQKAWFHHSDIAQGGKLSFQMGPEPNLTFGAAPEVVPPSLTL